MKTVLKTFVVVTVLVIVLLSIWLWLQKKQLVEQIDTHQQKRAEIEISIQNLKDARDIPFKTKAVRVSEAAEKQKIYWSQVLQAVYRYRSNQIRFMDFTSSSKTGAITISCEATSLEAIASLLEKLKSDQRIRDPFIANIAETLQQSESGSVFRFGITFDYLFTR